MHEDSPIGVDDLRNLVCELRSIAHQLQNTESNQMTLTPTALAMTALRHAKLVDFVWVHFRRDNQAHFFAAVTRDMRHPLVDHARRRRACGRDEIVFLPPDQELFRDPADGGEGRPELSLEGDAGLNELSKIDSRSSHATHQFDFVECPIEEKVPFAGCSERRGKRDLTPARDSIRRFIEAGTVRE